MAEPPAGASNIPDRDVPAGASGVRWFAVVLLLGYICLLAIGATSLWRIAGGGWPSWLASGVFIVMFVLGWGRWLKPGARHRLAFRERTTTHLVGGPIIIVLASLAHLWLPAIVALSVVVMCDALNGRGSHREPPLHPST